MNPERQEEFRRRLFALGFDDVRFATTAERPDGRGLRAWLGEGMHGEMAWMERSADKRLDPEQVLPGVRSVVLLGVAYAGDKAAPVLAAARGNAPDRESAKTQPVWARYALHEDYHDTMKPALVAAGKLLEEMFGAAPTDYRYYVDTGPVLERSWAARGGVGFVGKNAMLISRTHGNWLFLSAILSRVEFAPDEPIRKTPREAEAAGAVGLLCGKCTRCIEACPTDALVRPGVLDARRCISYQTIENKGIIPRELRAGIGTRIYGCDVCLEVCPWNRFARQGREVLLVARRELAELSLTDILELTPERFAEVFRRTPIKRVKLAGLMRNACIVAGNVRDPALLPMLVRLADEGVPLVRAHAVWAVFRIAGMERARELLSGSRAKETDASVLAEYEAEAEALEEAR